MLTTTYRDRWYMYRQLQTLDLRKALHEADKQIQKVRDLTAGRQIGNDQIGRLEQLKDHVMVQIERVMEEPVGHRGLDDIAPPDWSPVPNHPWPLFLEEANKTFEAFEKSIA